MSGSFAELTAGSITCGNDEDSYSLPETRGTSGQVLTSAGDGTTSFQPIPAPPSSYAFAPPYSVFASALVGNDVTGTGTAQQPFASLSAALASIAANPPGTGKRAVITCPDPSIFDENFVLNLDRVQLFAPNAAINSSNSSPALTVAPPTTATLIILGAVTAFLDTADAVEIGTIGAHDLLITGIVGVITNTSDADIFVTVSNFIGSTATTGLGKIIMSATDITATGSLTGALGPASNLLVAPSQSVVYTQTAGDDGQVLTMNADGMNTLWTTLPSPTMSLSQSIAVATPTPAITFDNLPAVNFYQIVAFNLNTDAVADIGAQFSTDNGATWETTAGEYTGAVNFATSDGGTSGSWGGTGGTYALIAPNQNGQGVNFNMTVYNFNTPSTAAFSGTGVLSSTSGESVTQWTITFSTASTVANANAIRFVPSTGNFTAGKISVYSIL